MLFSPCFFFVLFCSGETWTFLIEEGTCVTDCSAFSLEKEVCPSGDAVRGKLTVDVLCGGGVIKVKRVGC